MKKPLVLALLALLFFCTSMYELIVWKHEIAAASAFVGAFIFVAASILSFPMDQRAQIYIFELILLAMFLTLAVFQLIAFRLKVNGLVWAMTSNLMIAIATALLTRWRMEKSQS